MAAIATDVARFLLNSVVDAYVTIVALRFIMQCVRANYGNPLTRLIVRLTDPPLLPLRRVVPGLFGLDMAAIVLCMVLLGGKMLLLQAFNMYIIIAGYPLPAANIHPVLIIYLAAVDLLSLFIYMFLFAIIIRALISWLNPASHSALPELLDSITAPILRPVRRYIKPIEGFDLSPMAACILLYLVWIVVIRLLLGVL